MRNSQAMPEEFLILIFTALPNSPDFVAFGGDFTTKWRLSELAMNCEIPPIPRKKQ